MTHLSKNNDATIVERLTSFENKLTNLLKRDQYIAYSDYKGLREKKYEVLNSQFATLKQNKELNTWCVDKQVEAFVKKYKSLKSIIKRHNEDFIKKHLKKDEGYLNDILKDIDKNIKLDDEQRRVVLSDEDYTLVVAGAGTGKTTTIAAKIKYLVEKKNIKPEQILVISFTNKAVDELKKRINEKLKIDCHITTFHKEGYTIIQENQAEEDRKKVDNLMVTIIRVYLKENVLKNEKLVDDLILFFGCYFDAPYKGKEINEYFKNIANGCFTLRGNINDVIKNWENKKNTIEGEIVRSAEEAAIANFLYLNGIDYEYEKRYKCDFPNSYKPYTPDFTIEQKGNIAYIEHFGINKDGKSNIYNDEELVRYKKAIEDKISLHKTQGTNLICTYSNYNREKLLEDLKNQLKKYGFTLSQQPNSELYKKLAKAEENHYIEKLVKLICTFIQKYKTNGYANADKFDEFINKTKSERTKLFLNICKQCYIEYSNHLKNNNDIDFEDIINYSAQIIKNKKEKRESLAYKYIIVDEYQDISRQRFKLTKELSELCSAKVIAVGDDWQSIYAFSGSKISLFTDFKKLFGSDGSIELYITKTYRNAQELIDIAGGFIQKNPEQKKKGLVSPKNIKDPIVIKTYTDNVDSDKCKGKGGKYYLMGETIEKIVKQIWEKEPNSSILLLGRYSFDVNNLCKSEIFKYDEKTGNVLYNNKTIEFMTVHKSKGLGYDNVIIINARDETYGFPSQVQDDPVLNYVVEHDHSKEYAEERRLFYVALTRTKNRVYIVAPKEHPSEFVTELKTEYGDKIIINGDIIQDKKEIKPFNECPICGYPLQLRYNKNYGLKTWICSNEPEICEFITNDLNGGILTIQKCPSCDGYLVVKHGDEKDDEYFDPDKVIKCKEYFLGCTNYHKKGCKETVSKEKYEKEFLEKLFPEFKRK